jgi:hypothetical protein
LEQIPIEQMVSLTQVALSISPLVLLAPKKYAGVQFNREALIKVSTHDKYNYYILIFFLVLHHPRYKTTDSS